MLYGLHVMTCVSSSADAAPYAERMIQLPIPSTDNPFVGQRSVKAFHMEPSKQAEVPYRLQPSESEPLLYYVACHDSRHTRLGD